jgi:cysteine-rich repeat protein
VYAAALLLGAALACLPAAVFDCSDDQQCAPLGVDARCESVGYCSVPDDDCASMRRYHEFAGGGLAGSCTAQACGDGNQSADEACDDGNDVDGDGCNRDCTRSGQPVWTQTYASVGFVEDRAYALAVDSHGDFAVIGHVSVADQGFNLWIRKYRNDGTEVWTWVLDGGAMADEEGWAILADANDDFVVAGYVNTPEGGPDAWIGKLSGDGLLLWSAQQDGGVSGVDEVRGLAFAPGGDLVALGYATPATTTDTDLWFQRRSGDGQSVRWTQLREGFPGGMPDRGHAVIALEDHFVGVGYRQSSANEQFYWLARFDGDGNDVWVDEGSMAEPPGTWTTVRAALNGDLLLAGWRRAEAGDNDMWLQRRDPSGALLWQDIVGSPAGADDRANVIAAAADGGFVVGGEMGAGAGSTDAWIRRYDALGNARWTETVSGPAGDRDTIWGLGFDPAGNILACGYVSTPATSWDIWVRKYTP